MVQRWCSASITTDRNLVSTAKSKCASCHQQGHVSSKTLLWRNPPVLNEAPSNTLTCIMAAKWLCVCVRLKMGESVESIHNLSWVCLHCLCADIGHAPGQTDASVFTVERCQHRRLGVGGVVCRTRFGPIRQKTAGRKSLWLHASSD